MNVVMDLNSSLEEHFLAYWKNNNIYKKWITKQKSGPQFRFLDGPPFVSGDLHYGHLGVGYVKSSVLFYLAMKGHKISNKLGYDCHGLPIEMLVNDLLGINSLDDIRKFGILEYNSKCKDVIETYSGHWIEKYDRIGRWVDPENEYKTLDLNFMESVWWGCKELWSKGLIYKGYTVMPYSIAAQTTLSNFEAGSNYKDIQDPALFVKFKVLSKDNTYLMAWTTTPWTLPAHLALCVHPAADYVTIKDNILNVHFIVAESALSNLYKTKTKVLPYTIIEKHKGVDLVGLEYKQPFPYFESYREKGAFRVLADVYVKLSDEGSKATVGTGIVHMAPAHGADDYTVCTRHFITNEEINDVCPVDENGQYKLIVTDYAGRNVFDANKDIIKDLKANDLIYRHDTIYHSYPHCWRTDTPLIHLAQSGYFVRVSTLKERMIEHNARVHWVPDYVGHGRFSNWLENARDWCISRSRIFGTPLPIFVSDDGSETIAIGSIDELMEKAGLTTRPTDLHKDFIDTLRIPSSTGKGELKPVDFVFDCWFESGSVPYAQLHYPFENKKMFDDLEYCSDFICEGLDQTRGWFYTLLVLSTGLFDKPAYRNVICTGLVLAEDGSKMSKSKKNYPDPQKVLDKYGSDG